MKCIEIKANGKIAIIRPPTVPSAGMQDESLMNDITTAASELP